MECCGDPGDCDQPCEEEFVTPPLVREFFERSLLENRIALIAVPKTIGKTTILNPLGDA